MKSINQAAFDAVNRDVTLFNLIKLKTRRIEVLKEKRIVFDILFTQGFSQPEIAKFFDVPQQQVSQGILRQKEINKAIPEKEDFASEFINDDLMKFKL